jgi:hypothetical protein
VAAMEGTGSGRECWVAWLGDGHSSGVLYEPASWRGRPAAAGTDAPPGRSVGPQAPRHAAVWRGRGSSCRCAQAACCRGTIHTTASVPAFATPHLYATRRSPRLRVGLLPPQQFAATASGSGAPPSSGDHAAPVARRLHCSCLFQLLLFLNAAAPPSPQPSPLPQPPPSRLPPPVAPRPRRGS